MLVKEFLGKGSVSGKFFGNVKLFDSGGEIFSFSHYEYGEVFQSYSYEDEAYQDEMGYLAEEMEEMRNDDDYSDDDWQELIERKRAVEKMYKYGRKEVESFDFDEQMNVTVEIDND